MKEIGPLFLAGLDHRHARRGGRARVGAARHRHATAAAPQPSRPAPRDDRSSSIEAFGRGSAQLLAIALAIVSWGAYGPVLHKGQAAMHHSRMRPLICVGLAYFVIAVIVPYFFLGEMGEDSTYRSFGTFWSLLAGAFGAVGALGIIMAFNSGGKPVFVMPLVFGGAPVINTLFAISQGRLWDDISPFFWAGLILVIAGSAMVLVLAPRGRRSEPRVESREPEVDGRAEGGSGVNYRASLSIVRLSTSAFRLTCTSALCREMSLRHQAPLKRMHFTAV